jgi:hypothetical protein
MLKRDQVMQEEINSMVSNAIDAIEKKVELSQGEEDVLYNKLQVALEEFFGYPDFRHYL